MSRIVHYLARVGVVVFGGLLLLKLIIVGDCAAYTSLEAPHTFAWAVVACLAAEGLASLADHCFAFMEARDV